MSAVRATGRISEHFFECGDQDVDLPVEVRTVEKVVGPLAHDADDTEMLFANLKCLTEGIEISEQPFGHGGAQYRNVELVLLVERQGENVDNRYRSELALFVRRADDRDPGHPAGEKTSGLIDADTRHHDGFALETSRQCGSDTGPDFAGSDIARQNSDRPREF